MLEETIQRTCPIVHIQILSYGDTLQAHVVVYLYFTAVSYTVSSKNMLHMP